MRRKPSCTRIDTLLQRRSGDMARISQALLGIGSKPADSNVLEALGIPKGFEPMTPEDVQFMIDLMTLFD